MHRKHLRAVVGASLALIGAACSALLFGDDATLFAKYLAGFLLLGIAWHLVVAASESALASLGILFVAILTVFHGISNLLAVLFPTPYRILAGVGDTEAVDAFLVASVGILAFAAGYRVVRRSPICASFSPAWLDRMSVPALLVYSAVARVYRGGGRNYLNGAVLYWTDALLFYLEAPVLVLLILAVLHHARRGIIPRWAPWVLLPYAVAVALISATRTDLLSIVVSAIVLGDKWRVVRPTPASLGVVVLVLGLLFAAVATVRGAVGRSALVEATPGARAGLMVDSLTRRESLEAAAAERTFKTDLGYRVDGNALLGALPLEALRLNLEPVQVAAALSIPSYLYTGKFALCPGGVCSVKGSIVAAERMPVLDYLPTSLATIFACFGIVGGALVLGVGGAALRLLESRIARPNAGLFLGVVGAVLSTTLACGEGDITLLGLAPRDIVLLWVLFWTVFRRRAFILRERFPTPAGRLHAMGCIDRVAAKCPPVFSRTDNGATR